jgi:L-rhamnonate dehydratase
MLRNVAAVERLRASAGPVAAIALDARMGWTERYTVEMAAMLILHRVAWIEDCLPPREYRALARISRQVHPVRLAAGSCEHALDSFERMLEHGSVRVWRPDVHRCGGLTGLRRIAALAEAHGIEVSPRTAQMSYRRA